MPLLAQMVLCKLLAAIRPRTRNRTRESLAPVGNEGRIHSHRVPDKARSRDTRLSLDGPDVEEPSAGQRTPHVETSPRNTRLLTRPDPLSRLGNWHRPSQNFHEPCARKRLHHRALLPNNRLFKRRNDQKRSGK